MLDKPVSSVPKDDKSIKPLSKDDFGVIRHARDAISNETILDIIAEDPSSEVSYRNSLRRQILDGCASLRVNLISIDHLMEYFNKSLAQASTADSTW